MITDFDVLVSLLRKNDIPFMETSIYSTEEPYNWCGYAIWLNVGHIEFNKDCKITNIVNY